MAKIGFAAIKFQISNLFAPGLVCRNFQSIVGNLFIIKRIMVIVPFAYFSKR